MFDAKKMLFWCIAMFPHLNCWPPDSSTHRPKSQCKIKRNQSPFNTDTALLRCQDNPLIMHSLLGLTCSMTSRARINTPLPRSISIHFRRNCKLRRRAAAPPLVFNCEKWMKREKCLLEKSKWERWGETEYNHFYAEMWIFQWTDNKAQSPDLLAGSHCGNGLVT